MTWLTVRVGRPSMLCQHVQPSRTTSEDVHVSLLVWAKPKLVDLFEFTGSIQMFEHDVAFADGASDTMA